MGHYFLDTQDMRLEHFSIADKKKLSELYCWLVGLWFTHFKVTGATSYKLQATLIQERGRHLSAVHSK